MSRLRTKFTLTPGIVLLVLYGCSSAPEIRTQERDLTAQYPGGATTNTLLTGVNSFNQPAHNITDEHEGYFFSGNSLFNNPWVQAPASTESRDGLGPFFNSRSCSGCHFKDGRGRMPDGPDDAFQSALIRISIGYDDKENPRNDPAYGGQLQPLALPDVPAEATPHVTYKSKTLKYADGSTVELNVPSYTLSDLGYGPLHDDAVLSPRVAPLMIGLGLLEAISQARLEELADPEDSNDDGISGRIRFVESSFEREPIPGRFGWKSEKPTVHEQVAGAFLGDMGITSDLFSEQDCSDEQWECLDATGGGEPEINELLLSRVVLYSQLLAVPARRDFDDPEVARGEDLFNEIGCQGCHVPSHQTGEHPDLPEVSDQKIWPYTDLLLHDMGPELADADRDQLDAEWRTPPLWGIGLVPSVNGHQRLLHDGRADGVEEAILWHGGEADESRNAFTALDAEERTALIRFVNSL